jgi:histidinol-phosphatase
MRHDGRMDDLQLAQSAALAGAAVGLTYFARLAGLQQEHKADGSVVTVADRAVEETIRAVIGKTRPDDAVLGEEAGQTGHAGRRWIIDPIDGTAMFVGGDDRWLTLVALEQSGRIVAGVAVVPAQRRVWWAERGGGAYQGSITDGKITGSRPITCGGAPQVLEGCTVGVIPTDDGLSDAERAMIAPLTATTDVRRWGAHAGLLVATGEFDLTIQTRGQIWDYAATSIIVEEAGCRFGMLDGRAGPGSGPALYARNDALHAAARTSLTAPQV